MKAVMYIVTLAFIGMIGQQSMQFAHAAESMSSESSAAVDSLR